MLVRILNTLRSRIWDMPVFLFSGYSKFTVGEKGDSPEVDIFLSIIIRTIVNIYETRNCIGNERPENMTPAIKKFIEYLKYSERVPAI